jgi:hypothetical protein
MGVMVTIPDYGGGSLVNLLGEFEHRLTGTSASPRLHAALGALIPEAGSYVLVVFDGLGHAQLDHPRAGFLAENVVAAIDAPFPTTTTVSLATVATGLPPSQHGLLGYQLWLPEHALVVNTIKWTTLWGEPVDHDTGPFLPSPNLWERLRAAGVEPVTVQPASFAGSPMSRLLYRGCRFEPAAAMDDLVAATVELASVPGRLVVAYVPHVDFAAHVFGRDSDEYAAAVATTDHVWSALRSRLPATVTLVGTADHGHVDFPRERQVRIAKSAHADREFYGDGRAMFVKGEGASLAVDLPATWLPLADVLDWWGPGPRHPTFDERAPDGILVADEGYLLLHRHSDDRMIGNHGGLTDAEREIPLLVASDRS